jgi:hypothetical protein
LYSGFFLLVIWGKTLSVEPRPLMVPMSTPPDDTWVEWYWQSNTKELGENPVPMPFCPPKIQHELPWVQTQASVERRQWLNACTMAWPCMVLIHSCCGTFSLTCLKLIYYASSLSTLTRSTYVTVKGINRWWIGDFLWVIMSWKICPYFRGTFCFHLHCRSNGIRERESLNSITSVKFNLLDIEGQKILS